MSKFSTFPSHLLIRYSFNVYWPRPKVRILSLRPKKSERCFSKAFNDSLCSSLNRILDLFISFDWLFLPLTKDTYTGVSFEAGRRMQRPVVWHVTSGSSHEIIIFLSVKIVFFSHLVTKERLDPFFNLPSYVTHTIEKKRDNSCHNSGYPIPVQLTQEIAF